MAEPQAAKAPTRFGPVVLAGLMTAALSAVTSAKAWVELDLPASARVGLTADDLRADSPLALALALVVLAAWGVVLVSRERTRRIVLALAALADLGVLACVVRAPSELPDQIRTQLSLGHAGDASPTAAYWIALVTAIAGLAAIIEGLRFAPRWPEMSSRYDAPSGSGGNQPTEAVADEDLADRELWKAMDEGRDPTQG
ncbi:MAG: Trp biosynthesis-associated membrane protein [Marmoricola sp.]